ncbi:calcium-activated chloride channel regulator 1-like [Haemaphysalis longicornis]
MESESPAAINLTIQVKFLERRGNTIRVTTKVGNLLVDQPSQGIVYAKVTKGKQVVLNAAVGAVVSGHDVQGRLHELRVLLHDDGLDPDTDADDGTYSGYFTKFLGKGRYAVEGFVSNGNRTAVLADPLESSPSFFSTPNITVAAAPTLEGGASSYPIEDLEVVNTSSEDANRNRREVSQPLENFQRKQLGGSFAVTKNIVEKNVPPGNIRDLKVAYARPGSNRTLLVQLTWTWPGAHLTDGKASAVTIRASKDYASLKSSFHRQTEISAASVVVGNLNPLPYGARHVVTVALAATFATLRSDGEYVWSVFIAARITNSDGLSSDTSNTAAAWYAPPRAKTRVTVSDRTAAPKTTEISTTEDVTTAEGGIQSSNVVLSIGVLILIVVAAAVLLALNAIAVMRRFDVESSTSLGSYPPSENRKQPLETNP